MPDTVEELAATGFLTGLDDQKITLAHFPADGRAACQLAYRGFEAYLGIRRLYLHRFPVAFRQGCFDGVYLALGKLRNRFIHVAMAISGPDVLLFGGMRILHNRDECMAVFDLRGIAWVL
jgi:hypothetical protein